MDDTTVNFTTPETSTNSTIYDFNIIHSLKLFLYHISFIFGFPANCYILWIIMTGAEGRVALEFFNINLSVCEIGSSLNFFLSTLQQIWFPELCTLTGFLIGLGITGRPLLQCLMCVERYLAVVHPVTFLKYKPLRYRVICCAVAWIITLGICLCCKYGSVEHVSYFYTWFSSQFLLFISIQLFCLVAVLRALKQSGPGERKREKEENHMKRKAFNLILIITASMAIAYGPYAFIGFVTMMVQQLGNAIWVAGFTCYVFAGFVHPVLYLHRAGKLPCLCLP